MNVHNLELDYLKETLEKLGVTNEQIVAAWDQMALSYDHTAAAALLASSAKPIGAEAKN